MASRQVHPLAMAAIVVAAACLPAVATAVDWTVGDAAGWGPQFNKSGWTSGKTFRVGDTLLFKYDTSKHTLVQVGREDFLACNEKAMPNLGNTGNDVVTLDKPGKWWFICTKLGHCAGGMNLVVDVLDAGSAPPVPPFFPPSPAPTPLPIPFFPPFPAPAPLPIPFFRPSPAPAPAPAVPVRPPVEWKVGDEGGWRAKFNETHWADGKVFRTGDTLLFTYPKGNHTVHAVTKEDFAACNLQGNPLGQWNSGNDRVMLDTPGRKWFICSVPYHCKNGMKLVLDVVGAPMPMPMPVPAPAPTPESPPAAPPSAAPAGHGGISLAIAVAMVVAALFL
ncbi:hypothetical protein ACP4OV_012158 [Aristida adscensionis]